MQVNAQSILIRRLVQAGKISETQLKQSLERPKQAYTKVAEFLVQEQLISAKDLCETAALLTFHSQLDLDYYDVEFIPESEKNEKLIRKHVVMPLFKRHRTLFLAVTDPTDMQPVEDFQFNTSLHVETIVVEYDKLLKLIDNAFDTLVMDNYSDTTWDLSALGLTSEEELEDDSLEGNTEDKPVVAYINKVLADAVRKGASDLHFEPYEKSYRVRFRIDGILHEVSTPPAQIKEQLSARLKVMSQLDISEKRVPQDGRIKFKLSQKKTIDFRVSSLPTLFGEKIVMRILDSSSAMLGIDVLGYEPIQKERYLKALEQPQGMILITGPTGSGKTVSLYTGLNILNTPETNISTAEDPVEINLEGINQVQMNLKAGLTFPVALKAFLRQDPDVIMVGEIRDLETAEIAIKASQTGHLVLSTLHTNSAPETLTRLLNMGVPAYNVASSVSLIIAQRLARRLCNHCKTPDHLPEDELRKQGFTTEQIQTMTLFKPVGCDHCTGGYKGRVGIYEVMPISTPMADIIMQNGNSMDIAKQAQLEGINNLRQSGLLKAAAGLTSLAEVNRVTTQ